MTITKFVHSCLLVEEQGKRILIDPGNYTYEENVFDLSKIPLLEYIVITHEHPDHMYMPFIKEIVAKFPNVDIVSNQSVVKILAKEGIEASAKQNDVITFEDAPHEKVFGVTPPANSVFTLFHKLTDPGDSFRFSKTADILALPVQAPWGSLMQAVDLALSLRPKYIVPIHDWHWSEKARTAFYARLGKYFAEQGITFESLQTGASCTI